MKTDLTIKNFRVFDHNQGATIKLAPLTILTGCNSSGKSSVVKALLLLKNFFEQMSKEEFVDCKLDFANPITKLGGFDVVRNNKSNKGSKIIFAYQVDSTLTNEKFCIELTFGTDKDDLLNNGLLDKIVIKRESDNVIFFDANVVRKGRKNDIFEPMYSIGFGDLDIKTQNFTIIVKRYLEFVETRLNDPELEFYNRGDFYDKNRKLFEEAIKLGSLFPLELWVWTDNVAKDQVRKVIYDRIAEQEKRNKRENGENGFKYYEPLNALLDVFENSKHKTLREFFIESERAWLSNIKLQQSYNAADRGRIFVSKVADFAYSSRLFDMSLYETEMYSDDDGVYHQDKQHFNQSALNRFGTQLELLQIVDSFVSTGTYNQNDYFVRLGDDIFNREYVHKVFADFRTFYTAVMEELLSPKAFINFDYVGDASLEVNRLYTKDSKNQLFYDYAQSRLDYLKSDTYRYRNYNDSPLALDPCDFINKWLRELELGDHLAISATAEGLGVIVKIHKEENDKKGRLLADEGLGINKLVSILINLEHHILRSLSNGQTRPFTLAIEEPESHLHPRFQSKLAEMFVDAYKTYGLHVIVETHSEYLVRRIQTLVAKKGINADDVSIQYLYNPDIEKRPKGESQVKNIEIREDGTLKEGFGPGFFDEADDLAMDLLRIKAGL